MSILQVVTEDIPRIYTGIAEWLAVVVFVILLPHRYKQLKTALILGAYLPILCTYLYLTRRVLTIFWIPCMMLSFASIFFVIHLLTLRSNRAHLYFTIWAFLVSETAASFEWLIESFFFSPESPAPIPVRIIFVAVCYGIIFLIIYFIQKNLIDSEAPIELTLRDLLSAFLIMIFTFFISNMSFFIPHSPFSSAVHDEISRIRTLVDVGGIAILYAFQSRLVELNAKQDLATLSNMLKSQYESYRNYQETIDLINFKYHDLKNQLIGLASEKDAEKRNEYIRQMQKELESYRPERQTGNQVLDTIIASKSMRCRKLEIQLTCVAEGKLLEQMPVTDICTIFGNALDNAIEYVALIPEPEKRLIHLTLSRHKSFIYIECSNYCPDKLKFKNGLPLTTKDDKKIHGYGVRSIAYTVKKNHGSINFSQKDESFEMKILIPLAG